MDKHVLGYKSLNSCAVCGSSNFKMEKVLWPELVDQWQLSTLEEEYLNRQQGFHCAACGSNLRSMALAATIMKESNYVGIFKNFCDEDLRMDILEINQAGSLSNFLKKIPGRHFREYPEIDIHAIDEDDSRFDLVLHSDTLEHVQNPVRALQECRRILKPTGKCIFTIPIVVDRLSRNRHGLPPSYHGKFNDDKSDYVVHTEFGMDFWKYIVDAGFGSFTVDFFEYPSAMVLIAKK